jgi:hypothetical protein
MMPSGVRRGRRREDAMARSPASATRSLADGIREHRIYLEVQRETAQYGETRITVALQVWLWATVPKRAGSLPADPGCRSAVATLEATAAAAVARAGVVPPPDVEPFRWRLYESRHVADADELRLEVTLHAPPGAAGPEGALAELRRALEELGVFEGSWRPSLATAAERVPAPEPMTPRPAGAAPGLSLSPQHA